MTIRDTLIAIGQSADLVGPGFCSADAFPGALRDLEAARASGRSAGLGFTFSDPMRSSTPTASHPWARSLVVAGRTYLPEAGGPGPARPGMGVIARFATRDHYEPLRAALGSMADALRADGHRAEVLCDDNRLVDRAAAVRAGIAWWGKSAMVLAPGAGPWMLLGAVVTDGELRADEPMTRDCGTCDACIPACPTGAIVAPGVLDARRCLAAVLQQPGSIPRELRAAVGSRWYGCDECLTACPPGGRLLQRSTDIVGVVSLLEILGMADRDLRAAYPHFYVPRNEGRWLRRNAIVALGNAPDVGADLVLAGYLGHHDPMLRAHAAWALGRVGGARSVAALTRRRERETHPDVVDEIGAALGTLT